MEKVCYAKAKRLISFLLDVGLPLLVIVTVGTVFCLALVGVYWLSKFL